MNHTTATTTEKTFLVVFSKTNKKNGRQQIVADAVRPNGLGFAEKICFFDKKQKPEEGKFYETEVVHDSCPSDPEKGFRIVKILRETGELSWDYPGQRVVLRHPGSREVVPQPVYTEAAKEFARMVEQRPLERKELTFQKMHLQTSAERIGIIEVRFEGRPEKGYLTYEVSPEWKVELIRSREAYVYSAREGFVELRFSDPFYEIQCQVIKAEAFKEEGFYQLTLRVQSQECVWKNSCDFKDSVYIKPSGAWIGFPDPIVREYFIELAEYTPIPGDGEQLDAALARKLESLEACLPALLAPEKGKHAYGTTTEWVRESSDGYLPAGEVTYDHSRWYHPCGLVIPGERTANYLELLKKHIQNLWRPFLPWWKRGASSPRLNRLKEELTRQMPGELHLSLLQTQR